MMAQLNQKTWLAVSMFVFACVCIPFLTYVAWADEVEVSDVAQADITLPASATEELDKLQAQIESTAADYDQAVASIEELEGKIDANEARINEINGLLPGQQASAARALKALYILQSEGLNVLSLALSSDNLVDFLKQVDYIDCIHQHSASEISKLEAMKAELEETQDTLEKDKDEASMAADRAERVMEQAKAVRQQAQEKAIAEAAAAAEAEARQAALLQASAQAQAQVNAEQVAADTTAMTAAADAAADAQAQGASAEEVAAAAEQAYTEAGGSDANKVSFSDIDWNMDKDDFVAEWASRIDDYLAGTAMEGQGENYAEAAWTYGVDPRISPAISTVESATGSVCFADHNAWGWGSSSWSSWDEAIDAHVSGYAKGYSNNVSAEDAAKYCPPNAAAWQDRVQSEMKKM